MSKLMFGALLFVWGVANVVVGVPMLLMSLATGHSVAAEHEG